MPWLVVQAVEDISCSWQVSRIGAVCELNGLWHHVDVRAGWTAWLVGNPKEGDVDLQCCWWRFFHTNREEGLFSGTQIFHSYILELGGKSGCLTEK